LHSSACAGVAVMSPATSRTVTVATDDRTRLLSHT
jgi:hypothetical protein